MWSVVGCAHECKNVCTGRSRCGTQLHIMNTGMEVWRCNVSNLISQ